MIIAIIVVGSILVYGYWHSVTHASFYVDLQFKNDDSNKPQTMPQTEVLFLDSEGRVLAKGISDAQYNFVHLIHPEVGDCHEIEKSAISSKEARKSWQECFEHVATWIPKWAGKVRRVNLKAQRCTVKNLPVAVSQSNSDWYLWWVPLPHVGGKPSTYYSLSITVEENDCLAGMRQ